MKIALIAEWLSPNMAALVETLTSRDVRMDVIYPEKNPLDLNDLQIEYDAYLLKSGTDLAMSLAGILHELGARLINPYPVVCRIRNKPVVTALLAHRGIPVPRTIVAVGSRDLARLLESSESLVVKPATGSRGRGVVIVHGGDELPELSESEVVLAQQYIPNDGCYHKIYCIGERLFGVKRRWPLRCYDDKRGEPFIIDARLRTIVERCREVLGTDLFSLDLVLHGNDPYVVDVNKFGSFMGVPDAPIVVADYLMSKIRTI